MPGSPRATAGGFPAADRRLRLLPSRKLDRAGGPPREWLYLWPGRPLPRQVAGGRIFNGQKIQAASVHIFYQLANPQQPRKSPKSTHSFNSAVCQCVVVFSSKKLKDYFFFPFTCTTYNTTILFLQTRVWTQPDHNPRPPLSSSAPLPPPPPAVRPGGTGRRTWSGRCWSRRASGSAWRSPSSGRCVCAPHLPRSSFVICCATGPDYLSR